jgi:hypothetical protein
MGPAPVCTAGPQGRCVHLHKLDPEAPMPDVGFACDAFPDGIPDVIIEEGNPHTSEVPGDHGIRYEGSQP